MRPVKSSSLTRGALLEWVGTSSPPCEEDGQPNCLEHLGDSAGGDGVEGSLLSEGLRDELIGVVSMKVRSEF